MAAELPRKAPGSDWAADLQSPCPLQLMEARLRTPGTNPSDPARVLIVEDELRLRELLVDVIPEMGFRAVAVRSAEEAKKLMESDPYEIVMLDLQLPVMGGMNFFEQMRQRWPTT